MMSVLMFASLGIDNGRGVTPPLGWRSWNLYGPNVNQQLMEKIMDGMVTRNRTVDGVPTSLCDLCYCDVGLDDNWQECGSHGKGKYTYHSDAGFPIVNAGRFPDMLAMTNKAHGLGLTAGWYMNVSHGPTNLVLLPDLLSSSSSRLPASFVAGRIVSARTIAAPSTGTLRRRSRRPSATRATLRLSSNSASMPSSSMGAAPSWISTCGPASSTRVASPS